MQRDPRYVDVALEVAAFCAERVAAAERAGIPRGESRVDPGIGFGKTVAHNLALIARLPLLAAASAAAPARRRRARASSAPLGEAEARTAAPPRASPPRSPPPGRAPQILRVHDVAETVPGARAGVAGRWRRAAAT